MSAPRGFTLSRRGRPNRATADARGAVQIRVVALVGGRSAKGNVTHSFTVLDAKVSEVYAFIRKAMGVDK